MYLIKSQEILSIAENIVKINNNYHVTKDINEHLLYVLFRRIKQTYNTYTTQTKNLYVVHAFQTYNDQDANFELLPYEYENFMSDFSVNIKHIDNVEQFFQFLQKYFIFVSKSSKDGITNFIKDYISLADNLSGSEATTIVQTSYINDFVKVHQVKKSMLPLITNKLNSTIDFVDFHFLDESNAEETLGMSFLFYFNIESDIKDIIELNFHKDIFKHQLTLKQYDIKKYLKNSPIKSYKHKIIPVENSLIYGAPFVKKKKKFQPLYGIMLEKDYFKENKISLDKTKFKCVEAYDVAVSNIIPMIEKIEEKEHLRNKLVLKGRLDFTYDQYFDLISNQLNLLETKKETTI